MYHANKLIKAAYGSHAISYDQKWDFLEAIAEHPSVRFNKHADPYPFKIAHPADGDEAQRFWVLDANAAKLIDYFFDKHLTEPFQVSEFFTDAKAFGLFPMTQMNKSFEEIIPQ